MTMSVSAQGDVYNHDWCLVDDLNQTWSISPDDKAWVLVNGQQAGNSYNAAQLLYYNKTIYHVNTSGSWYSWGQSNQSWTPCQDPRMSVLPKMFYGINMHDNSPMNSGAMIKLFKDIGLTSVRMSYEGTGQSLWNLSLWAKALQGTGISMVVCINAGFADVNSNVAYANEAAAYAGGKAIAVNVAQTLVPLGVNVYELGNEYTRRPEIITNTALMGSEISDFKNAFWPQMRGLIRGMLDGVKSVKQQALCAALFCVADVAASDALWNGTQPDGTSGWPKVRWDITSWHNYEVYGNIFDMSPDGEGSETIHFDLVNYCDTQYGVPFMITEWNAIPEKSNVDKAIYIPQALGRYYTNRNNKHGIKSVMLYQLLGNPWGITDDNYSLDGSPQAIALKKFIAANPE